MVINEETMTDAHSSQEAEPGVTLSGKSRCGGLHAVCFYSHNMLEITGAEAGVQVGAAWAREQVVWKGSGWSYKRAAEGFVW